MSGMLLKGHFYGADSSEKTHDGSFAGGVCYLHAGTTPGRARSFQWSSILSAMSETDPTTRPKMPIPCGGLIRRRIVPDPPASDDLTAFMACA